MNTEEFKPGIAYPLPVPFVAAYSQKHRVLHGYLDSIGNTCWFERADASGDDTHWTLLPEIPKPKSQEEIDQAWIDAEFVRISKSAPSGLGWTGDDVINALKAGINYARKP